MPAFIAHAPKDPPQDARPAINEPEPALPFRSDTILGVCEGIGQDLAFNPLYLRLVFAGSFFFNPVMVIGSYVALGAGLALARWLYPVRTSDVVQLTAGPAARGADNEDSEPSLAA